MIILTIFLSFVMLVTMLIIGLMVGYSLGHKNDRTLKQQVSKLKTTISKHNESKQLKELSVEELKLRKDWDFRSRLAEITGSDVTTEDAKQINDDPNSMDRMF